ncbi:sensor histidine kinase [Pontibacillus litoralis JSM 072002]|uniref:histidine kinase n=1 Tax=Pontibacillus litoralis JSM 072002 TaxID=1385512 RepID=A0A0A5G4T7_9BACI|nr:sensor histidine kinase [Pontibacillus litoralis JSM 072002]
MPPKLTVGLTEEQLHSKKTSYAHVLHVVRHFMQKAIQYMNGTPTFIVVTDNDGYLLESYGDQSIKNIVDSLGISPGIKAEESNMGTNSICLALKYNEPIAITGEDHYHECLSGVACYSVPFSDSPEKTIAGTISIMTTINYASELHLGLLSSAVDSIERELLLQEKNQQLHLLIEAMINSTPLGIIMVDYDGNVLEFNEQAEEITGICRSSAIGKEVKLLDGIGEHIQNVVRNEEEIKNMDLTIVQHGTNNKQSCLVDVLPLFNKSNQTIGAFAQLRDITCYYALQKQVIESEKLSAIGKLGAGLAHEIRNPLTSIIGLTQLLKADLEGNHYLNIITTELERVKNLVNQFVSLGKPTTLNREQYSIYKLVEETVHLMNSNSSIHTIHIRSENNDDSLTAFIDKSKIKQVLINFIKNAIEAMPDGGVIYIHLTYDDNEVYVSVEDKGEGMTQEEIHQISTPFFTTKEGGLGMGLPICFDIVKSHHGEVHIDSKKYEGTTICMSLPIYYNK